ncbi:Cyclic AMP-responsive element-binding 3 1 [Paramuricea clavata]|uniref:Cyclic AMP-responsive element-binding 3 1 n=1 Tax=Paramuricea clavata TaxID=317549 RepID=A0A7D9EDL6_PARCT|nr:Cyclic AMP-responsive element-binding 3 1 [Paramuricea clavata]
MDYYHDNNDKSEISNNLKEMIHNKVVSNINIKSFFSDQLTEDHLTPLSKAEEYALKKVRRKLKNKISAQESRKRKKYHLENLEKRVHLLGSENESLKKKLEKQNQSLRSLTFQLSKLKSIGAREKSISYQNQGTQTGTCLKCYLQKQPEKEVSGDFKVQSGKNGRIAVQSDFMENYRTPCSIRSEYTDFNSILHSRSLRDRA